MEGVDLPQTHTKARRDTPGTGPYRAPGHSVIRSSPCEITSEIGSHIRIRVRHPCLARLPQGGSTTFIVRLFFSGTAIRVLVIALLVCLGARADRCTPVRTTIVTTYSLGPGCTSPVGVCTVGVVSSPNFAGTSRFTAMTINPGPSPDMLIYAGELVITTSTGTITIRDHGFLNSATAQFLEVQQIVVGTGDYAGMRGMLTSRGISTATGFQGTLSGAVCAPSTPVADQPFTRPVVPGTVQPVRS